MKREYDENKRRPGIMRRLGEKLDIPEDVINGIHIELRGRSNIVIRGCCKILLYTTTEVRIRLRGETLSVTGAELYCTAYHSGVVEIDGLIVTVGFI